MNTNKYQEVINGKDTYKIIAELLSSGLPVFIGWTDEKHTHYDILFTYGSNSVGVHQCGLKFDDLFVSIMGIGAFGFKTDSLKETGYVAEKLFRGRLDESVDSLTDLINGIIRELKRWHLCQNI